MKLVISREERKMRSLTIDDTFVGYPIKRITRLDYGESDDNDWMLVAFGDASHNYATDAKRDALIVDVEREYTDAVLLRQVAYVAADYDSDEASRDSVLRSTRDSIIDAMESDM